MTLSEFKTKLEDLNNQGWPEDEKVFEAIPGLVKEIQASFPDLSVIHEYQQDSHSVAHVWLSNITDFPKDIFTKEALNKALISEKSPFAVVLDISYFDRFFTVSAVDFAPNPDLMWTYNDSIDPDMKQKLMKILSNSEFKYLDNGLLESTYSLIDTKMDPAYYKDQAVARRLFGHY